ncbi:efflux RND transporter periplasmic adaptor subunit [Novosphingobium sp. M1R2S20]|uniref:Efflux RND transporter periplasmic adaptor subunit n=1 Tax=Novosphingobium rhizovicinum TaxID=3228928 RepID=A0ABV3RF14_9SPHN
MIKRTLACVTLIAGLALSACGSEEDTKAAQPPTRVVAQTVQMLPEQGEVDAIGTARAVTAAELYPEAAGLITAVRFSAGDRVARGAPLVQLDDRRERLAVRLARVAVAEADQLLGRYRRIEDTGALSASQIEAGETALQSAKIQLEQAQVALADRTVRAPFSGFMGIPQVDRGDRITPTTLIGTIDDRSTLFVDFPAPEAVFDELQPGATVELSPYSGPKRTIQARVQAVDSAVTAETRSFTVRTVIPNRNDAYRPGMSFRAKFAAPGQTRPAVPESAVVWGGDGSYVWAVRSGVARRVPVTIAARRSGMVLLSGKLRPQERIIVEGVQKVREGQRVTLVAPRRPEPQQATVRAPKPPQRDGAS